MRGLSDLLDDVTAAEYFCQYLSIVAYGEREPERRAMVAATSPLHLVKTPAGQLGRSIARPFFVDDRFHIPVMARTGRVTLGLIGAGMVIGALVGMAAILPLWLQHVLHQTPYDGELGSARSWIPVCAAIGASVGGILGPSLGYGLLRSVALWRVVIEPLAGAVVGCAVGWAIFLSGWVPGLLGASAIIWASALGALGAGIRLRLRYGPGTTRALGRHP